MPKRRQGYKLNYVLLALLVRRGSAPVKALRRLFGRRVYAYLARLEESGVVVVRSGVASLNTSFNDLVRLYQRELDSLRETSDLTP